MNRSLSLSGMMIAAVAAAGIAAPAGAISPQPIPPSIAKKVTVGKPGGPLVKRGIIVVGGRYGKVALNPQPLPPKAKRKLVRYLR